MNVFPQMAGQTFMVSKGPTWSTIVKKAASGRQVRCSLQATPIWTFKVGYEFIRDRAPSASELQALYAFFSAAQGQFKSWYFLDPYDNAVSGQLFGVGDGATTTFQLSRTLGAGTAYPFSEPVFGVVGVPSVKVNGVVASNWQPGSYGAIVFTSPPAAGAQITWSGQFYFLCHFTQDTLSPTQMVKDLWSLDGVEFESLIP